MISVVLVEDEAPAREELRFLLEQYPELKVIGEFDSGLKALENIPGLAPDVVFIDVHLQDTDGLDVVHTLQHLGVRSAVVFATAYDVHAVRAFELNAVDYILKPFSKERLALTVSKIRERLRPADEELSGKISRLLQDLGVRQRPRKLSATCKGRVSLIDPEDVLYVVAEGRYASLVTPEKTWPTNYSLQEVEERLDPEQFVRTHRAYIVNLDKVKEVLPWFNGTYKIIIDSQRADEIPVSRTHVRGLREKLDF